MRKVALDWNLQGRQNGAVTFSQTHPFVHVESRNNKPNWRFSKPIREISTSGRRCIKIVSAVQTATRPGSTPQTLSPAKSNQRQYGNGKDIVIVGAGPGGLLSALLLAQRGYNVNIYEKRPEPDQDEVHFGSRSIVFGLVERGQNGLKKAGIRLPVRGQQDSIWLNGLGLAKGAYSLSNKNGKTSSSFSKLPPSVLFVERAALVEHMISEIKRLQPERLKLHYGQSLADIDFDQQIATFESDSGAKQSVSYSLLVGADGRRSKVREHLEGRDSQMYHKEFVAERSYKGFHRLPALDTMDLGDETGIPLYFHLYGTDAQYNMAFWPTRYGTVTGHVSCPRGWFQENPNVEESYEKLIRQCFPLFPEDWIPEASKQLVAARAAPNGASIWCSKLCGPQTVILGDAAHGVTPALGQGCNCALESAVVLTEILDGSQGDLGRAPEEYSKKRLPDVHALYHMDRNARKMSGFAGWNFVFFAGRFHMFKGMMLKKIFPSQFTGPAYGNLMRDVTPYSKVYNALQRDRYILLALIAGAAVGLVWAARLTLSYL